MLLVPCVRESAPHARAVRGRLSQFAMCRTQSPQMIWNFIDVSLLALAPPSVTPHDGFHVSSLVAPQDGFHVSSSVAPQDGFHVSSSIAAHNGFHVSSSVAPNQGFHVFPLPVAMSSAGTHLYVGWS